MARRGPRRPARPTAPDDGGGGMVCARAGAPLAVSRPPTGARVTACRPVRSGLESAVFTPDGKLLVTPTSDGSGILLWDTATRRRAGTLRNEHDMLLDAAVSPDGQWLAAAAYWQQGDQFGSRLQVWDLPQRK